MTPEQNYYFLAEFRKTLDKRRGKMRVMRRRQLNKGCHFPEGDDGKKVVSFSRKK